MREKSLKGGIDNPKKQKAMICTLSMRFQKNTLEENCETQFIERLENLKHEVDGDGVRHKMTGNIRNYGAVITADAIYLNGSLTKFFHGTNVLPLTIDEMREALNKLSDETGLPIYRGEVMRIDAAVNVFLSEKPKFYFRNLMETPGYDLQKNISTVKYTKDTTEMAQSFVFYDKMMEMRKNDNATYNELRGNNIIRIEDRYLKRARTQLMKSKRKFIVAHLLTTGLQKRLLKNWLTHYEAIEKNRKAQLTMDVDGYSDIRDIYLSLGIDANGGILNAMQYVDAVGKANGWNRNIQGNKSNKTSKVKGLLKAAHRSAIWGETSHYISELNEAVAESEQLLSWLDEIERKSKQRLAE